MSEENIKDPASGSEVEEKVKVSEMKRRLDKQREEFASQIESLNKTTEEKIQEAINKTKMSQEQLKEYEDKEAERKQQEKDEEIKRLKSQLSQRDLKDKAKQTLTEREIPVTDDVLTFVVKDNAEDTLTAIEQMANILTAQKNELTQTDPPLGSGGFEKTTHKSENAILDEGRII